MKIHQSPILIYGVFNVNRGLYGGSVRTLGTRYGVHVSLDKGNILEGSYSQGNQSGSTGGIEYKGYASEEHEVGIEGGLLFGGSISMNSNDDTGETKKELSASLGLASYKLEEISKDGKIVEKRRDAEVHVAGVSAGVGVIGMEVDVSLSFPENLDRKVTPEQSKLIEETQKQIQQDNMIINKEYHKLK